MDLIQQYYIILILILDSIIYSIFYFLKWTGLGILSSIGCGFGIHTFAPFVSAVTLAAWECYSLDFPPPFPNIIQCPHQPSNDKITILMIISKVKIEAFAWGIGTAIGELPPYLLAFAGSQDKTDRSNKNIVNSFLTKIKLSMSKFVQKSGFIGILICASVPNPFFDIVGITCGIAQVSFWTFFWAIFIGKAVVKVFILVFIVVFLFSSGPVETFLLFLKKIPVIGQPISLFLSSIINEQKINFHPKSSIFHKTKSNIFRLILNYIIVFTVIYFLISLINMLANSFAKRSVLSNKD